MREVESDDHCMQWDELVATLIYMYIYIYIHPAFPSGWDFRAVLAATVLRIMMRQATELGNSAHDGRVSELRPCSSLLAADSEARGQVFSWYGATGQIPAKYLVATSRRQLLRVSLHIMELHY